MWPFDKILSFRIKDLERQIEFVTGANSVLERELEYARNRADRMEQRLLEYSGISRANLIPRREEGLKPIVGARSQASAWPEIRANLENKAKQEYWEKQKIKMGKTVDELEKEVLGTEGEEDASKIT